MKKLFLFGSILFALLSCGSSNRLSPPKPLKTSVVKPQFISDESFTVEVIENEGIVVVDFWADWCGPCKEMDPVLVELANQFPEIKFVKIDIDENELQKAYYDVRGLPAILFFKNGVMERSQIGLTTKQTVINHIQYLQ